MRTRPARPDDATAIAEVHVAAWRSAYAGILPTAYLAKLSLVRHAAQFHAAIAAGPGVLVAELDHRIVGFCTTGPARTRGVADAEVETLYVLDDHRDQGLGRSLLRAAASHLAQAGSRSLFLWVLDQNPNRWFYERLGGRAALRSTTRVAGTTLGQTAYVWDPIGLLIPAPSKL